MAERLQGAKRRWAFSVGVATVVMAGLLVLLRNPKRPPDPAVDLAAKRTVTLVSAADKAVNDETVLLDPTPLFLPTKWNATQKEITPPEAGGRFQGYDAPKFSFRENELKVGLPAPIKVPAGPAEAVAADAPMSVLVGFGRTEGPSVTQTPRGAFVEIVAATNGRRMLAQSIPTAPTAKGVWQPVEFLAGVDAAGLVGPLVVTSRSGLEEVDGYFASYLTKTMRIGERLAPGFYRICVGP